MFDVCLVTPGYLVSSPRVVRAADALAAAGWAVAVVSSRGTLPDLNAFDDALVHAAPWQSFRVHLTANNTAPAIHPGVRWESWFARRLCRARFPSARWAASSSAAGYARLRQQLRSVPTRLVIGHTLAGIALADQAAACARIPLALDIEDLHAEDVAPDHPEAALRKWRAGLVQRHALPRARWLTAASVGMAERIAEHYRVPIPAVIHNVPFWSESAPEPGPAEDRDPARLSLAWFSQTIGPDRGLETLCAAALKTNAPLELHLRGSHRLDYIVHLRSILAPAASRVRLVTTPQSHPDALVPWLAQHDVGLALEPASTENRRRTVSNKLFTYLHAGLAVLASDTPGQTAIHLACPDAIRLFQDENPDSLAAALAPWLAAPAALAAAKSAALAAARDRWNYQHECRPLLAAVRSALSAPCASS
jgi:glycosyltransferase involved in cell wall biosynthesis